MLGRLLDEIGARWPDVGLGCTLAAFLFLALPFGVYVAWSLFLSGWGFFGGLWR